MRVEDDSKQSDPNDTTEKTECKDRVAGFVVSVKVDEEDCHDGNQCVEDATGKRTGVESLPMS